MLVYVYIYTAVYISICIYIYVRYTLRHIIVFPTLSPFNHQISRSFLGHLRILSHKQQSNDINVTSHSPAGQHQNDFEKQREAFSSESPGLFTYEPRGFSTKFIGENCCFSWNIAEDMEEFSKVWEKMLWESFSCPTQEWSSCHVINACKASESIDCLICFAINLGFQHQLHNARIVQASNSWRSRCQSNTSPLLPESFEHTPGLQGKNGIFKGCQNGRASSSKRNSTCISIGMYMRIQVYIYIYTRVYCMYIIIIYNNMRGKPLRLIDN